MAQKLLQYDVLDRLGEGAGSIIYAVSDPETRRVFALKHVTRANPKDIRFVEQMETEFEISKQFTHPNLRRSYDLKINKTLLLKVTEAYLLMELFDGKPLDVRPPSTMLEIVDVFIHAAQGLKAFAERRNGMEYFVELEAGLPEPPLRRKTAHVGAAALDGAHAHIGMVGKIQFDCIAGRAVEVSLKSEQTAVARRRISGVAAMRQHHWLRGALQPFAKHDSAKGAGVHDQELVEGIAAETEGFPGQARAGLPASKP